MVAGRIGIKGSTANASMNVRRNNSVPLDRGSEEEINTIRAEKLDGGSAKGAGFHLRRRGGSCLERSQCRLEKKVFMRTDQESLFVEYAYPVITLLPLCFYPLSSEIWANR
jgi:hypothetical protein